MSENSPGIPPAAMEYQNILSGSQSSVQELPDEIPEPPSLEELGALGD